MPRSTPETGRRAWAALALAAAQHAAVDAACGVLLWGAVRDGHLSPGSAWAAFLLYNLLAFAVQPLLGLAVDRGSWARGGAVSGAALTAAGLVTAAAWPQALAPAIAAAGLGNALFHIGGGILSLRLQPGRATAPGLFVAPGAAGVTLGIVAGRAGAPAWPFVAAIALLATTLWFVWPALVRAAPSARAPRALPAPRSRGVPGGAFPLAASPRLGLAVAVALLLLVVALRSFVGLDLVMPWKSDVTLLATLTAAVVLGKAAGGVAADRFGWRPVACGALLVSVPLLAAGASPWAGVAGILVFNMTMPVTLAATARLMPGQEGFALGLTCLALFCGALPVLAGWAPPLGAAALAAACGAAALALWAALAGRSATRARADAAQSIHPERRSLA